MEPLSYKKMDFEEFCAAAISTYQLEALEKWEDIASAAFRYFELEGNRVTSIEELGQVSNLTPPRQLKYCFTHFHLSTNICSLAYFRS